MHFNSLLVKAKRGAWALLRQGNRASWLDLAHRSAYTETVPEPIQVSCLAFSASADMRANATRIDAAILEAAASGSRLLLTPECALVGYPGVSRVDLDQVDWRAVASLEDQLAERANEAGIVLVLGTVSLHDGRPTNDALVCGAVPHEQRYLKRCLTPLDREHFIPGYEGIVFEILGWRFGLTICFDLRFPTVWADLALGDADAFLSIAHMSGGDVDPGCKASVIPAHYASRAAEWATPLLMCNTADDERWVDTGLWDARGICVASRGEGLIQMTLEPRETHDPWYEQIRDEQLRLWRNRLRSVRMSGEW